MSQRRPDQCPFRRLDESGGVTCEWIREQLGELPSEVAKVSDAVCEACCRSFLPTEIDWNPVVASLVWSRIAERLPELPVDSTSRKTLSSKQERAESNLPLVTSGEEDLPRAESDMTALDEIDVDRIAEELPLASFGGEVITRWAVGVTTAPRRIPTLETCLESMSLASWETPRLFVDGQVELPANATDCSRTSHVPPLGAWRNYYLAVTELLRMTPAADGILIVQDDALWPRSAALREYLRRCRWPRTDAFVVSFYCCSDYTASHAGWREFEETWVYGAVALGFSRVAAEQFVCDPLVLERCRDVRSGGVDTVIGEWATRCRVPVLVPTPSVVQHVGDVSTLWETSRAVGVRRAARTLAEALGARADKKGES